MLVAGEASGDAYAAELIKALRESAPHTKFEFFGAAGLRMRAAGIETIVKTDDFSIVGLPEIARALPMFWRAFQKLKQAAVERKADAVILIDFPDFNLRLARSLKKQNLKIIYYISPQLWAWRKYRIRSVEKYIDLLLTILPFEKDWYAQKGIGHVEFVGNPLAGEVKANLTREEFCAKHNLDSSKPIVALLPGSRHKEIVRILPPLLETASAMVKKNAELQFIVALASGSQRAEVEKMIEHAASKNLNLPETLKTIDGETREVLNAADAAAVTSGTATLETAIVGTPMAIVYKTSKFNYAALHPLINVEHFGLINLIAGKRLVKEFIQGDFTKEKLSAELFRLLEPQNNRQTRKILAKTVETLGRGGASKRAAQAIISLLQGNCF
jgi:lipid-A-disaccharide synthase